MGNKIETKENLENQTEEKEDNWFIMQEIPNTNYLFWVDPLLNVTKGVKHLFGFCPDGALIFQNNLLYFTFNKKHWRKMGEKLVERFVNNPGWQYNLNKTIKKKVEELYNIAKQFKELNFVEMSNEEISLTIAEFLSKYRYAIKYGNLQTAYEFDHQLLTNYLNNYLSKKGLSNMSKIFSTLTTFTERTHALKEECDRMRILDIILSTEELVKLFKEKQEDKIFNLLPQEIQSTLHRHFEKYCWLEYMYQGPIYDRDHFIRLLREDIRLNKSQKIFLKNLGEKEKAIKEEQKRMIEDYNIDLKHIEIFELAKDMIYLKSYRKDISAFAFYCLENALREVNRRININIKDLFMCTPDELEGIFEFIPKNLNKRREKSVYCMLDGKESLLIGEEANQIISKIFSLSKEIITKDQVNGQCAVPGYVTGIVKIINTAEDILKMKQGNILVSNATYPALLSAMKKASAIVTDLGGITCHSAIVSRELNISCVVGTRVATKVFKDGDIVCVDAEKGIVKKIK